MPGYEVSGHLGIGAPKTTPADIVEKLNKECNAVLADPDVRAKLAGFGSQEPVGGTPAAFGKQIADEIDKWAKVIRFAKLKKH